MKLRERCLGVVMVGDWGVVVGASGRCHAPVKHNPLRKFDGWDVEQVILFALKNKLPVENLLWQGG